MVSKKLALDVINIALSTGGDYAELYVEKTNTEVIHIDLGKVESSARNVYLGAGLRIFKGLNSLYGYTSDLSKKGLFSLAKNLSAGFSDKQQLVVKNFRKEKTPKICPIENPVIDVDDNEKVSFLKKIDHATHIDPRIVRSHTHLTTTRKTIEIYKAEEESGSHIETIEDVARIVTTATAKEEEKIESGSVNFGASASWDTFIKKINPQEFGEKAAKKALSLFNAKECPSGKFPVVIGNGWGGVLFHEACGHSLEASSTAKGQSVFSNCIGKQIASPLVSAFDDGSLHNYWGSTNMDSEGVKTKKNALIKNGICVGYLIDKLNGRRLNMAPTGSCRREDYSSTPTSRMNNTYIAPGKDNPEDIIRDTKLGLYVVDFGGGSVDTMTGEFNFAATEAYIIRDGKVAEPVKGCILIGTGKEVLMNIDHVGNDLAFGCGMCGASSGYVPVTVGQPTIRVKEITVGGRGGELK